MIPTASLVYRTAAQQDFHSQLPVQSRQILWRHRHCRCRVAEQSGRVHRRTLSLTASISKIKDKCQVLTNILWGLRSRAFIQVPSHVGEYFKICMYTVSVSVSHTLGYLYTHTYHHIVNTLHGTFIVHKYYLRFRQKTSSDTILFICFMMVFWQNIILFVCSYIMYEIHYVKSFDKTAAILY